MRVAVDVCVGKRGIRELEKAGHVVVVAAKHAESDKSWFARALAAGAEVIIAIDSDLEVLCYDNHVPFIRAKYGAGDLANARRTIAKLRRLQGSRVKPLSNPTATEGSGEV